MAESNGNLDNALVVENGGAEAAVAANVIEPARPVTASDSGSMTALPVVRDSPLKRANSPPLKEGDEFPSKDALMAAWAPFRAAQQYGERVGGQGKWSNQTLLYLECIVDDCSFCLGATASSSKKKPGVWRVTKFVAHNCRVDKRRLAATRQRDGITAKLIRAECEAELRLNPNIRPVDVTKRLQAKYKVGNLLTSNKQLYERVVYSIGVLRRKLIGGVAQQFRQLRAYLERIKTTIGAYCCVDVVDERRFRRLFLMLDGARDALPHVRRVLGLDGGHLRNKAFFGVLLMLTCKDAENQIIPLCIGVVESENGDSWLWFLRCLRHAAPFLLEHQSSFVVVSDFDKGAWNGVAEVFPGMKSARDIIHLKNNIMDKCKSAVNPTLVKQKLLQLAAAATERKYNELQEEFLRQCFTVQQGAVVRRMLAPEQFADYCFTDRRRYGMYTSQFAESANHWVSDMRTAPGIVDLVRAYLQLMSKAFSERKAAAERLLAGGGEANEDLLLSKYAQSLYNKRLEQAQHISLHRSNVAGRATVRNQATGRELEVDGLAEQCNCHRWQFEGMPCGHGVAVLLDMGVEPKARVESVWTARALVSTYSGSLVSFTTKPELDEDDLLPPVAAEKKLGRPSQQKRKLSRGEVEDNVRCGNCGRFGHNRRTCRFPALNPYTTPSMEKTPGEGSGGSDSAPPPLPPKRRKRGPAAAVGGGADADGFTDARVTSNAAVGARRQWTRQDVQSLSLARRRTVAEELLHAVPLECPVCDVLVDDDDEFLECKKCCRWLHRRCVTVAAPSAGGGDDRFVCGNCNVAVPSGLEPFPCATCRLNVLNHSVLCDECNADTHLVCVDVAADANLDALDQFLCVGCSGGTADGPTNSIVPCRNVGNTCYFNCLIACLQALPVTVLAELARSNKFLRLVAHNVVKQRVMVGRHAMESCVSDKHYCTVFEEGREHDVAEALDYVMQHTAPVKCLQQELLFQYRDIETCGGCGRIKELAVDDEHCLKVPVPDPGARLEAVSLQELVWHRLEHGENDRLCSACSESAAQSQQDERQRSRLRTHVLIEPRYLVLKLVREFQEPQKGVAAGDGDDSGDAGDAVPSEPTGKRSTRLAKKKRVRFAEFRTVKSFVPVQDVYTGAVVLSAASKTRYSVCAVAYHRGSSINGGHWFGHVKHPVTGRWWRVDDGASSELQGTVPKQPPGETTTASFLVLKADSSGLGGRIRYEPTAARQRQLLRDWDP